MRRRLTEVVLSAAALVVLASCQPAQPWSSELAGVDETGAGSSGLGTSQGAISPDGSKVAFVTSASDLGPTDTNGADDVYVRDLATGVTSLISVNEAATDSGNGASMDPQWSADGKRLAFRSSAADLTSDDPDEPWLGGHDIFVRDLTAGRTTRVDVLREINPSCVEYRCYWGVGAFVMTGDFGRVAYAMTYSEYFRALLVHDVVTGETTRVDYSDPGAPGDAVFSPDSTLLAFTSWSDLVPTDTDGEQDVYVYDVLTGTPSLVSVPVGQEPDPWQSSAPAFSSDSTRVLFESSSDSLGPVDTNDRFDVYVRDLVANTTTLVSANAAGTNSGNGHSSARGAAFTNGDTGVVFTSIADDLGPTDTNGQLDVYHRNLTTGVTTLVSANAGGTGGSGGVSTAVHGRLAGGRVPFLSTADDLGPRDTNGVRDLYARDLATGVTTLISADATGADSGNGAVVAPAPGGRLSVSDDGRRVVFSTSADDLGPTDTNGQPDVYVATLGAADLAVTAHAAPDPVPSGGTLTYAVDVTSAGPDPADGAAVLVVLPEGTEFVGAATTAGSCQPPATENPRAVVCALGTAAVGDVATITVDAHVTATAGSTLSAVALTGSSITDDRAGNNVVVIDTVVA